ncbi:MAG: Glutaredoxin 4 [Legionellaceae bacterium]
MDTISKIKEQIAHNPILLYMKGSSENPMCGFSASAVAALKACGADFASIDVLENSDIRQVLPTYANWPTFPQLYIQGELIGGCDIMMELFESGELQQLVKVKNAQ